MQITRQADYAMRAVLYLARRGPHARTATAQIAREQHIPLTFLAKIISQLAASGIVHASRGAHGGVTLARPAASISLLEVVEAIDGALQLNECVDDPQRCPQGIDCPMRQVWCDAQAELVRRLAQTRFDRLVQTPAPALDSLPI